jgi:hypothetical protein
MMPRVAGAADGCQRWQGIKKVSRVAGDRQEWYGSKGCSKQQRSARKFA